jgi:hypothetical protein
VLLIGDDVVDLDSEVAAGQLHGLGEVADDGVDAVVVAGSSLRPGACQTLAGSNSSPRVPMSPLLEAS